jgi:hypothetical protein
MTTLNELRISPRWLLKIGDTVKAQRKPGGRTFTSRVRAITVEAGQTYVQVTDPRNGGTYTLSIDLVSNCRKAMAR